MPTITNPAVSSFVGQLKAERQSDANFQVDDGRFNKLIGLVAEKDGAAGSVTRQLGDGSLLPAEKLAVMKKNLSASEMDDMKALVADGELMGLLKPDAQNLLNAIVGLSPLAPADGVGDAQRVDAIGAAALPPQKAAVSKMKTIIESGKLQSYYDAIIGAVDNPALKAEAEALFDALPKVSPSMKATQMVELGLWTRAPRGLEAMQNSARYLPGRQIKVKTTVNTDLTEKLDFKPIGMAKIREDNHVQVFQELKEDPRGRYANASGKRFSPSGPEKSLQKSDLESFLSYDANGTEAITYRATLMGEDGDDFLVKVDGKDDPIKVPKEEVYKLNQRMDIEGDVVTVDGKVADYNDPLTKAKVCEAAIKMDKHVQELDFTQTRTMASGMAGMMGFGSGRKKPMVEIQQACVQVIHDVIDMRYHNDNSPGRKGGRNVGRQAIKGAGVCFEQSGVMAGLVAPFHNMLGIDIRTMQGGNYRSVTNTDKPFRSGGHMWLELTYRPSMRTVVTDRTWGQSNFPIDKAYSFFGDRYPGSMGRDHQIAEVETTDLNLTGDVTVKTFERQFGATGDGRENHISGRGSGATLQDD